MSGRARIPVFVMPQATVLRGHKGDRLQDLLLECGVEFPCGGLGRCRGCRVRVIEGDLEVTPIMSRQLSAAELAAGWRLACQARVSGPVRIELCAGDMPVLTDGASLGRGTRSGFGIAVDLGTTTVAAELLDLASGAVLEVRSSLNPQAAHGADVMTRIGFALHDSSLTPIIRTHLGRMLRALARGRTIAGVVIVGNTAMRQIFCGFDVEPLSRVPFVLENVGDVCFNASELGWQLAGDPEVRIIRAIGGFVGSDILAGVLACGLAEASEVCALVDLGTNGEIVVGDRTRLLCASAAAGPAFEAASIRCGMRAARGAIHHVSVQNGELRPEVLGGGPPRGICGSGLIDAAASALDLGLLQPSGKLCNGTLSLAPGVALSQRDIRELQFAKGAIAAGLRLLSARLGARAQDLHSIYLAGAFGNYVRVPSARRIGLLEISEDRVSSSGNTALRGAKMMLMGAADPGDVRCEHICLADDAGFQETFAECLAFPQ